MMKSTEGDDALGLTRGFLGDHIIDLWPGHGKYEVPMIKQPKDIKPPEYLTQYQNKITEPGGAVHFYIDDYRFDSIWTKPEKSYDLYLSKADYALTPDFSMYPDWPIALNIWNLYRNRWCGALWAHYGMAVIPCISFCNERSFEWAFDGVEKGSMVSISARCCVSHPEMMWLYDMGYKAMIEIIDPSMVLVYGSLPEHLQGLALYREYPTRWDSIVEKEKKIKEDIDSVRRRAGSK